MHWKILAPAALLTLPAGHLLAAAPDADEPKIVEVDLDYGAYDLRSEAISYEIMDPAYAEKAAETLAALQSMQGDMRICINAEWAEVADNFAARTDQFEADLECEERIVEASNGGRDFVEVTRCPMPDAPGAFTTYRRDVTQSERAWQSIVTNDRLLGPGGPMSRSVMRQSLTYVGECKGDELNLSEEFRMMIEEMKKPEE